MATLLEANEVTKIYAKGQRPSLNKVSFNVAESEFIAIMGASGSGKTTLLNVLSTIDTAFYKFYFTHCIYGADRSCRFSFKHQRCHSLIFIVFAANRCYLCKFLQH